MSFCTSGQCPAGMLCEYVQDGWGWVDDEICVGWGTNFDECGCGTKCVATKIRTYEIPCFSNRCVPSPGSQGLDYPCIIDEHCAAGLHCADLPGHPRCRPPGAAGADCVKDEGFDGSCKQPRKGDCWCSDWSKPDACGNRYCYETTGILHVSWAAAADALASLALREPDPRDLLCMLVAVHSPGIGHPG